MSKLTETENTSIVCVFGILVIVVFLVVVNNLP